MVPAKKTLFADDETVNSSVVEDFQEFDADLIAALYTQPIFHPQDKIWLSMVLVVRSKLQEILGPFR